MEHWGRTVLAMDCVLAGAEKHRGRPLNSVVMRESFLFSGGCVTKPHFARMAQYNAWANARVYATARSLPPSQTRANLDALLGKLEARRVPVVMLGMLAAPNLGADYAAAFNPAYPALAKKYDATLVPFFLGPLLGHPELVQADHIHPTEQGVNALVAATVDKIADAIPPAHVFE